MQYLDDHPLVLTYQGVTDWIRINCFLQLHWLGGLSDETCCSQCCKLMEQVWNKLNNEVNLETHQQLCLAHAQNAPVSTKHLQIFALSPSACPPYENDYLKGRQYQPLLTIFPRHILRWGHSSDDSEFKVDQCVNAVFLFSLWFKCTINVLKSQPK